MTEPTLPLATRLWFAFVCLFRVLFDGAFAYRAFLARTYRTLPAVETGTAPRARTMTPPPPDTGPARADGALQLLALLQRDGRLIDFLQQDVDGFSDVDIGAAARVVHQGCRAALKEHVRIVPVRGESEGKAVTVDAGEDPAAVKLTGNVSGAPPYRGTLRHRGWRAESIELPEPVRGHDATVLAPAEVEL